MYMYMYMYIYIHRVNPEPAVFMFTRYHDSHARANTPKHQGHTLCS